MAGSRDVLIDDALGKIERLAFTREDAIDLIASSQNRMSWTQQLGHPLDHCDMILHAWPQGRTIGDSEGRNLVELGPMRFRDAQVFNRVGDVDGFAADIDKPRHSFAWTDLHLIQALKDMFLAKGAYTALWKLRAAQTPARLIFKKPTSHTTVMDVSVKSTGTSTQQAANRYLMVLDLCAGRRLQLQTLYPIDAGNEVFIKVRKPQAGTVFETRFPH
jgi:hypothetical protein